ncbi:DUF6531 domain-containing protein [Myxococcus sp. K38C18041901]|uniref:DUF6531 domain-containing protein n=1 Tax=Myxococcus guangdongensis TaxID=2906760 RepID=UPI0020A7D6A5|nr:DUF6531 domain-containing protein [Myxococcus guangdongensis]MCP3063770.1 DUF6531 domain-containing protein [Myxococcus guangdongensis]
MIASTFFDLVIGVDIHFEMVPTPALVPTPFPHPFVGMVYDPSGLVTGLLVSNAVGLVMGSPPTGPVLVNCVPATNTGTEVKNSMVLPHIVIPPGTMWTPMPKAPKPKIGKHGVPPPDPPVKPAGDAVLMMGSKTVTLMGSNAVRLGDLAMSCSEPLRLPSSMVLAIPKGLPVLVGGPPAIDWQQALGALLRSKWVANHLHGLMSRIRNVRLRNFLHSAVCFLTGHPVDVMTGRVLTSATDFELPGPLPLRFERNYASSWAGRDSVLGYGWSHSLDQAVWLERGKVVYRAEDGREIEFDTFDFPDHVMRKGDRCWDPYNRLTLRCLGASHWEVETAKGLTGVFAPVRGDTRTGQARLVSQRTREGHHLQLGHDQDGNLEWVTDSGGRKVLFEHDPHGRLVSVSLPRPRERGWVTHARYVYSPEGDLVEVHDALGNVTRCAYEAHLLVRETDRTGLSFYFGYDGLGADAYCVRTWGDGGIYDHVLDYDPRNHVTCVTDSLGHVTTYQANAVNAVVKVVDALGGVTRYEYDDFLRKTAEVDPLGNTTRYEYDARGNRTRTTGPEGAVEVVRYDASNQPLSAIDVNGGAWAWRYDDRGLLLEEVNPLGQRRGFAYKDGLLTAVDDGDEASRTEFGYDTQGNLEQVRLATGAQAHVAFDRLGRPVHWRDAGGAEGRLTHDPLGRLLRVETHSGAWEWRYDAEGCLVEEQGPSRHLRMGYEGYHHLAWREEAGARVLLQHDTEGWLTAVVNEAGERYELVRDALGQVTRERGFDGAERHYRHDAVRRLVSVLHPSGRSENLRHDVAGRLIEVTYSDGAFRRFRYRQDGLLMEAQSESGSVALERDVLGRVIRERQGECVVASHYARGGQRFLLETSLGGREVVFRDGLGELQGLHLGQAHVDEPGVRFERDEAGCETARRLPGGVEVWWRRDQEGRPLQRRIVKRARGATREQQSLSYQWEHEDRLVALGDARSGTRHYAHDERGRLVGSRDAGGSVHRGLDVVGNLYRTPERTDRRYGAGGLLREADGTLFEHDLDGNVTLKRLPTGETWRYAWSGAGLLKEVVRPDGLRTRFEYDALARRTRKQTVHDAGGEGESTTSETRFIWDGDVVVHELVDTGAQVTWYWEPGTFTPVAKEVGGRCFHVVSDHLGTPTELYDDQGELAWRMQLDILGVGRADVALESCPWRWPGQYEDPETGLYYNRFRYYDPSTGRYLSQDLLGLKGGLDLYGYVPDPLIWLDPLGLLFGLYQFVEGGKTYIGSSVDTFRRLGEHVRADRLASRSAATEIAVDVFGATGRDGRRLLRLAEQEAMEAAVDSGLTLSNEIRAVGRRRAFYERLRNWYRDGQQGPKPCK